MHIEHGRLPDASCDEESSLEGWKEEQDDENAFHLFPLPLDPLSPGGNALGMLILNVILGLGEINKAKARLLHCVDVVEYVERCHRKGHDNT